MTHWIWSPVSLAHAQQRYVDGRAGEDLALLSWEDWSRYLASPPPAQRVFILVELPWLTDDLAGLAVCRDLLAQWPHASAPQVVLFSFRNREQLWQQCSEADRHLIKNFPIVQLPSGKLPALVPMSPAKWRYLRKYALTRSGILDHLLHGLRNAIRAGDAGRVHAVTDQLRGLPDLHDEQIRAVLEMHDPQANANDAIRWAGQLSGAMERRIYSLEPDRLTTRTQARNSRKPHLLLVEDDSATANELSALFTDHFEVKVFNDGAEALHELEIGGRFYDALVADLELLEADKRFDQPVQGIEVLEYAEQKHPHIARRVITALGRRGVRELLPGMSIQDILFKSLLVQGNDPLFLEFLEKLLRDVDLRRVLQDMPGPDSTLWADVSKEARQQDSKGGGFKRFYYQLKVEDPERFGKLWREINDTIERIRAEDPDLKVDASFVQTEAARSMIGSANRESLIGFLQKLLTHRAILLTRYTDGGEVPYRDETDRGSSYAHLWFWKSRPAASPKSYNYFTGMSGADYRPAKATAKDDVVRFKLKYSRLFREEVELIKRFEDLRADRFGDFFNEQEDLCYSLNQILGFITDHRARETRRPVFKDGYPAELENAMTMDRDFAQNVLVRLSQEPTLPSPSSIRMGVRDLLIDYRVGRGADPADEGTPDFQRLPEDMRQLVDQCIDSL